MRPATLGALLLSTSPLFQACSTFSGFSSRSAAPAPMTVPQSVSATSSEPDAAAAAIVDQANQYARDGLYREAIASFRKYLADHPKDAAAHRTLGIIYVKSGAYKLALKHLQEALTAFPDNFELNYYIGEAYRTQNQYADAIFHYQRALQSDPKNIPALKALTWSFYSIRYHAEAIKSARQLKKLDPNDFQIAIIQARIMNRIGMNDQALVILNKAEALASPDEIPFLNSAKGDILMDQGEKDRAEQAYRKALQDQPLLPGALTGLAKKLMTDSKGTDQAITYLERALRIKPNHVEAVFLLGQAYERKDPKRSLEYYRKFHKEAALDPQFQQEVLQVRGRLAEADRKAKPEDNSAPNKAEDLEDQL